MPRSYPKNDSDFKFFSERVKPTLDGERYLSQWSDMLATIQQLTKTGVDPRRINAVRSLYIRQSNGCSRTLGELEERYGWPSA